MSKRDTKKVNKKSILAQDWALDKPPHKSTKKAKAKERQDGKKEINLELIIDGTTCIDCGEPSNGSARCPNCWDDKVGE
jgi:hypothetical protein